MIKNEISKLYEKFETKERQGPGNRMYKYVPSEDIIDRMNKTFNGAWSVEIKSQEIIEDQILIRVRVSIVDIEADRQYSQEGFASHDIARYSSGSKQGKAINIGNDFKSATSKAIRTACARWGAGLYLDIEDVDGFMDTSTLPVSQNTTPSFSKNNELPGNMVIGAPPSNMGMNGPPSDFTNTPPKPESPAKTNVINNSGPPSNFGFSPPPEMGMEPVNKPSFGDVPTNNVDNTFNTEDSTITKVSDVQKVAIQTILDTHSLVLGDLLIKVFGDKNHVASIDELSYSDGVMLIKEGNKLNRL